MARSKPLSLRRCSVIALAACLSSLSTGCTKAMADAAAAGALNFIQSGVTTVLSSVIFGDDATSEMDEMGMDETMMSGGDHEGHGSRE